MLSSEGSLTVYAPHPEATSAPPPASESNSLHFYAASAAACRQLAAPFLAGNAARKTGCGVSSGKAARTGAAILQIPHLGTRESFCGAFFTELPRPVILVHGSKADIYILKHLFLFSFSCHALSPARTGVLFDFPNSFVRSIL